MMVFLRCGVNFFFSFSFSFVVVVFVFNFNSEYTRCGEKISRCSESKKKKMEDPN